MSPARQARAVGTRDSPVSTSSLATVAMEPPAQTTTVKGMYMYIAAAAAVQHVHSSVSANKYTVYILVLVPNT